MKIYFQNSVGQMRLIASKEETEDIETVQTKAFNVITEFCVERHFGIPYVRMWNIEKNGTKMTQIDVGSHTEFFFVEPPILPVDHLMEMLE